MILLAIAKLRLAGLLSFSLLSSRYGSPKDKMPVLPIPTAKIPTKMIATLSQSFSVWPSQFSFSLDEEHVPCESSSDPTESTSNGTKLDQKKKRDYNTENNSPVYLHWIWTNLLCWLHSVPFRLNTALLLKTFHMQISLMPSPLIMAFSWLFRRMEEIRWSKSDLSHCRSIQMQSQWISPQIVSQSWIALLWGTKIPYFVILLTKRIQIRRVCGINTFVAKMVSMKTVHMTFLGYLLYHVKKPYSYFA